MKKTIQEMKTEIIQNRISMIRESGNFGEINFDIQYLGQDEELKKHFFRIIEDLQPINDENQKCEIFYEYGEVPELIGVRTPETRNEIIPIGFDGDKKQEWDIQKESLEKCLEEREKQLKAIAKELGIKDEEIESISEIDLEQKIKENIDEKEKNSEQKDDESQKLSKEEVQQMGMTGINEVDLNAQVDTKGTTLRSVLKLDGYSKIMVVHSYKLAELADSEGNKGKINNIKFGLIAQKNDGTYETIPESKLTPYRGENREVTQISNREDVEVKKQDCMFEIPGTNKKLVIDQKDPYGIAEVYLSQTTKNNDGNMAQKLQDKYDGTQKTDVEVRALYNHNKGEYQADKMQDEMELHKEAGCEDLDIEEVNGDPEDGHVHFNPENQYQKEAIEEIMRRGNVSREEAEIKLEKQIQNNEDITLEQAKEEAISEIEEEYMRGEPRKR